MSSPPIEMDPYLLDGLTEIGNIGAAHATTALSKLIDRCILVEVSEHYCVSTQQLPAIFGDPEQRVVAVYLEAQGSGKGRMLLMLSEDTATSLVDMMLSRPHEPRELNEEDRDAICEVGNICASAYLSAVAKFCDITIMPSPPGVAVDMLHAIMQFVSAMVEEDTSELVVVRTQFKYGDSSYYGFLLYLPDRETIRLLAEKFRAV
jgi:chemotaxis protein CheC